jgi:hypothetical protein
MNPAALTVPVVMPEPATNAQPFILEVKEVPDPVTVTPLDELAVTVVIVPASGEAQT